MPPPAKISKPGPPARKPLPRTSRAQVVRKADGYQIHTVNSAIRGSIVGPRLDKCKTTYYPDCETSAIASLDEARAALLIWDKFLEAQEPKTTKRK